MSYYSVYTFAVEGHVCGNAARDHYSATIILFGATDDLLKIKTLGKMHQNYDFLFLFFSVFV